MTPVRLEPVARRSLVKHPTTVPLRSHKNVQEAISYGADKTAHKHAQVDLQLCCSHATHSGFLRVLAQMP